MMTLQVHSTWMAMYFAMENPEAALAMLALWHH